MKKILLFLSFLLMSIGVWGDELYKNTGVAGTSSSITASGNINNTASNGNPAPSWGLTSEGNKTITITGLNVSEYTNLSLTLDAKWGSYPYTTNTWPFLTVTFYENNNVVKTDNTTIKWTSKVTTYNTYTIDDVSNFDKITIVASPAIGKTKEGKSNTIYQCYVDNIIITGDVAGVSHDVTYINKNDGTSTVINYTDGQHALLDTLSDYTYWEFCGWTLDTTNCIPLTSLNINSDKTLYSVFRYGSEEYKLVEKDLDDWRGDYLIAYSSSIFADGRVGGTTGLGAQNTSVDPDTHLSGKIIDADWGNLYNVTVDTVTGGYVIITKDGKYNYQTSNSNGLASTDNKSTAANYPLSITFNSSSDIDISISAGAIFHYNDAGYFRFYKNGSQNNIYLYKKVNGYKYCINPSNIKIIEWLEDSIRLNINNYDSVNVNNTWELLTKESDNTYKVYVNDLVNKSCTDLVVKTRKDGRTDCINVFKIPIFITENNENNSTINNSDSASCDLVILKDGKLTLTNNLENRDVIVYPSGTLNIPSGKTYKVNSLTLRRDNDSVPYLSYNGTLNITNDFKLELRTDASDWRWMTLPCSYTLNLSNFGDEVLLRYYDGDKRARTLNEGWKALDHDTILNAGDGFVFGIDIPSNTEKRIYTFNLNKDLTSEQTITKNGSVVQPYGKNLQITANNKGWNIVGNPYLDSYISELNSSVKIYELEKDLTSGQWNGSWLYKDSTENNHLKYAVIPVPYEKWTEDIAAAGGYKYVLLDDWELKPFTSFFIQYGGEPNGQLVFNKEKKIHKISSYNQEEKDTLLRIKIDDKSLGCFISNKYTDDYEPGDDLESKYIYYLLINGYKLLYSAINDSIIEHGIKVYTTSGNLHLDNKTNVEDFDEIYALYNDNWIDLLHLQEYNVNGEFTLFAKRKKQELIPTSIDVIEDNKIIKFIFDNNLYIKKNDHIYNILGGKIK